MSVAVRRATAAAPRESWKARRLQPISRRPSAAQAPAAGSRRYAAGLVAALTAYWCGALAWTHRSYMRAFDYYSSQGTAPAGMPRPAGHEVLEVAHAAAFASAACTLGWTVLLFIGLALLWASWAAPRTGRDRCEAAR